MARSSSDNVEPGPASRSVMRKSCYFCRSRKIRCSGQSICGACQERNLDCSYEKEGAKGRPRGSAVKSSSQGSFQVSEAVASSMPNSTSKPVSTAGSTKSTRTESHLPPASNANPRPATQQVSDEQDTCMAYSIAVDLQNMFERLFIDQEDGGAHYFDNGLIAFHHRNSKDQEVSDESGRPSGCTMSYEGLFFMLAQELVESLTLRFGNLGCRQGAVSQSRYLVTCLTYDDTTSMFDLVAEDATPLLEYDNHRTLQMVEAWFSHHPLSFILSKTLLLRSLRSEGHDDILLATILADVKCAQDDGQAQVEGEELFRWASSRLHDRPKEGVKLPIIQALVLLGWHELCMSRARRAMCYFGWADSVIENLPQPKTGLNQINGIDVGGIELELSCNVHWITFSVTLWALLQTDSPISRLLPLNAPDGFPPVDESTSAVFKLDMLSYNSSTLSYQARMFRELWPLSHVASTTANIYALYPWKHDSDRSSPALGWQSRTSKQLRQLSSLRQDLSVLCAEIRLVLMDALELVETHVENPMPQALVLSAYHTMIIHFLFPRLEDESGSIPLTRSLLDDFSASAESLLKVLSVLNQPPDCARVVMGLRPSSDAGVFLAGLDACGRAMNHFCSHYQTASEAEKRLLLERGNEFSRLATELHAFSNHLKLSSATRLRTVKKQLKYAMRSFEGLCLESQTFGNPEASMNLGLDPRLDLTNFDNTAWFNPYLPKPPNESFKDRIFPFFGACGDVGSNRIAGDESVSKKVKQTVCSQPSGEAFGPFEGNAFLDDLSLDETSSGSSQFDPGLGPTAIDFSNTAGGDREGGELRSWLDFWSSPPYRETTQN